EIVRRRGQRVGDEGLHSLVVIRIRADPTGVGLGLVQGLLHVVLQAAYVGGLFLLVHGEQGPSTDQGLIEQILFVGIGRADAPDASLPMAVHVAPATDGAVPFSGHFREDVDARANVFATLGIVRGSS